MAPEISLANQRPAVFVFDELVKDLRQREQRAAKRSDAA